MSAIVQAQELVRVPFHGEELWAFRHDGKVWVVIRRCCEALGLSFDAQRIKLLGKRWAVVTTIVTTGGDGKRYEMLCLDLERLPMWLATIDVGRVRPEAKPALERFQDEAAQALRDHFFGRRQVERAWSARLNETAMEHRRHVNRLHPGWWSVVTELMMDFLAIEDELHRHGYPLRLSDQPDGSAGIIYAAWRETQAWAPQPFKDCPLLLIQEKGERVVFPRVYPPAERARFRGWFETVYAAEHLSKYLISKAKRDAETWGALGFAQPSQAQLMSAASGAMVRIGSPAALMGRWRLQGELGFKGSGR